MEETTPNWSSPWAALRRQLVVLLTLLEKLSKKSRREKIAGSWWNWVIFMVIQFNDDFMVF